MIMSRVERYEYDLLITLSVLCTLIQTRKYNLVLKALKKKSFCAAV